MKQRLVKAIFAVMLTSMFNNASAELDINSPREVVNYDGNVTFDKSFVVHQIINNKGTILFNRNVELSDSILNNYGKIEINGDFDIGDIHTTIDGRSDPLISNYKDSVIVINDSSKLDIDNHYGLAITNNGNINIASNNYFIGTDYCCDWHANIENYGQILSDGHAENPGRNEIINNSGTLVINGGQITSNDKVQIIQGQIVHNQGAVTNITLNGYDLGYSLRDYLEEDVNYREVNNSLFLGGIKGGNDDGFSLTLNPDTIWETCNQEDVVRNVALNGGAIIAANNVDITKWPDSFSTLKLNNFYSDGNFSYNAVMGNFAKVEGFYVYTDLKNNQGDRLVFTGSTPDKIIPLGIINRDDSSGEPISEADGHSVVVATAPADTKMDFQAKMIVYGSEIAKLYGRSLTVDPLTVYEPIIRTEYKDGGQDGIEGLSKNWVFTGWGDTGETRDLEAEKDINIVDPDINVNDIDMPLKRLNDIRTDPSEVGVWIRGEKGDTKIRNYKYEYNLMSGGYDWHNENDARKIFYGFGITYSTNDCDDNVIGDTKSLGYNLYGSWLGKKNNDYVDVVLKWGTLDKDYAGLDRNGVFVKGDYDKDLFAIAAQYGRRIFVDDSFYYEPQIGYTYGRVGSADFIDNQNTHIHADSTNSHIASLGVQVGKNIKGTEVYGKLAYVYDFDGNIHVSALGISADDDMGGGYMQVAIGASRKVDKDNSFYIDVEKDFGNKVKKPYAFSVGYRHTF